MALQVVVQKRKGHMVIMLGTEKEGRTTAIMPPTAFASACATTESSQYFFRFPPVLANCPTTTPAIVNATAPNASSTCRRIATRNHLLWQTADTFLAALCLVLTSIREWSLVFASSFDSSHAPLRPWSRVRRERQKSEDSIGRKRCLNVWWKAQLAFSRTTS